MLSLKRCRLLNVLFLITSLSFGLILNTGCQVARMAVPPDLESGSEVFPCTGRQGFTWSEKFTFGPYAVTDVHRGWTCRFANSLDTAKRDVLAAAAAGLLLYKARSK